MAGLEANLLTAALVLLILYAAIHIYMNGVEKLFKKFGYKFFSDDSEMGCLVYVFLLLAFILLSGIFLF
tara:strand:- start:51 stop:257 length:207 start_codon:yes stop_codon:yes gene_type:complete